MADNDSNVLDLWQKQTSDGFRMNPAEIKMKADALDTKLRARTRGGYLVSGFLIIAFTTWGVVEHDPLMRLGCAATVIAVAFLGIQVHRGKSRKPPASAMATPSIDHLRSELQRQVDFHRGKRLWSRLLTLGPAGLLFYFAFARAHPELIAMIRFEIVSFVLILIAAIPLNLRLAKKYQRQVDELDRQKEHS